jgi:putative cationic outer membrane protein ompH
MSESDNATRSVAPQKREREKYAQAGRTLYEDFVSSRQIRILKKMKRTILIVLLTLLYVGTSRAQSGIRYGYIHYNALLRELPEYAEAEAQYKALRQKYAAETEYNEMSFKRLFAEYLQGQKEFTQNILLKRQRDLQEEMEKSLAFRQAADSLLAKAQADLRAPAYRRLNSVLQAVGNERGYELIINLDERNFPFFNPRYAEDATPYVRERLKH